MDKRKSSEGPDGFTPRRKERDSGRYLRLHTAAMTKLFRQEVGRGPRNAEELTNWARTTSKLPKPVNPYEILTIEEVHAELGEG